MQNKSLVVAVTLVLSIVIDQITKIVALSSLEGRPAIRFFGDFFVLTYAENPGAMLSFGSNMSPAMRMWIFVVFVAIALSVILWFALRYKPFGPGHALGLALIVGGGSSNLIDRIFRDGHVIDFLNIGIGSIRTGVFNIADVLIFAGAAVFFYVEWTSRKPKGQTAKS